MGKASVNNKAFNKEKVMQPNDTGDPQDKLSHVSLDVQLDNDQLERELDQLRELVIELSKRLFLKG